MSSTPSISWVDGEGASYRLGPGSTYSASTSNDGVLYLFMDESGNLDFGKNGSPYFYMTCLVVRRPFSLEMPLTSLRYDFIEDGNPIEAFHACDDKPEVRYKVLKHIGRESHDLATYTICIKKHELPTEMQTADMLYSKAFEWITEQVYQREVTIETELVIVITDDLPKMRRHTQVVKHLKEFMKRRFQLEGIPYMLLHHKSCSSAYLQIADYLSWALQRKMSRGQRWAMDMVADCFREIGTMSAGEKEEDDPR